MKMIKITELDETMILGQPIKDYKGNIVIEEGSKLDVKSISKLMNMGIMEVPIKEEVEEGEEDDELSKKTKLMFKKYGVNNTKDLKEKIIETIDRRFEFAIKHPAIKEIKKIVLEKEFSDAEIS